MNSLRAAAALAVAEVIDQRASADSALNAARQKLDSGQHPLLLELVNGALRWHGTYASQLEHLLKKPFKPKDRALLHLLVIALYELDQLATPAHAAINEAVNACKALNRDWTKAVVNGVLRNWQRSPIPFEQKTALRQSFPGWLVDTLDKSWGNQTDAVLAASNARPPLVLRLSRRQNRERYLDVLAARDITANACGDSPTGISLETSHPVTAFPGFAEGLVSVQDESAQLVASLLQPQAGERVLDACAAPGGKTLHLWELAPDAQITALDFAERLPRLQDNLQRCGANSIEVIAADLLEYSTTVVKKGVRYDKILLDVPCSGTGVMRRHPDIRYRRQPDDIAKFCAQQDALLAAAWDLLAPGGWLLYTTCSILPAENEARIAAFLASHPEAQVKSLPADIGDDVGAGRQRLPGIHSGDGFYYGLLQKPDPAAS